MDLPDAAQDPHAEWLHVLALTQELSGLEGSTQVQAFMARLQPGFLSRHPGLLLDLANAATRGVGENADALDDIARQCLQATRLMPEPSGADAVAVWQSLIAQLRGLQGRLAQTLVQALGSLPMPEALRQDCAQACQATSVSTPGAWPIEILQLMAPQPASAATLGTMAAFYRELNHCLSWLLVDKKLQAVQQPKLEALLRDWMGQWQPPTRAGTPPDPKLPSLGMLRIYNFSRFLHKTAGRGEPLLLALDEATEADAPRQLQTLLPYLWTQACLKWTRAHEQVQLARMGKRLLAQLERCSLPVQRRLLVGMAYGGDNGLRTVALQGLREVEKHPSLQQRLRVGLIERCLKSARLSSEEIDAVLLDLEQTPLDQVTELGYLRQLVKVSHQVLGQDQRERALNCTLALRRFEAHCDRLGLPQTAHQSI